MYFSVLITRWDNIQIILSVSLVIAVIVIVVLLNVPKPAQLLVPGFYSGKFGPDNRSGKETAESCLQWAKDNKYPVYGYRNEKHGNAGLRKSCFSYTKIPKIHVDGVHTTGCTDTTKSMLNGCI